MPKDTLPSLAGDNDKSSTSTSFSMLGFLRKKTENKLTPNNVITVVKPKELTSEDKSYERALELFASHERAYKYREDIIEKLNEGEDYDTVLNNIVIQQNDKLKEAGKSGLISTHGDDYGRRFYDKYLSKDSICFLEIEIVELLEKADKTDDLELKKEVQAFKKENMSKLGNTSLISLRFVNRGKRWDDSQHAMGAAIQKSLSLNKAGVVKAQNVVPSSDQSMTSSSTEVEVKEVKEVKEDKNIVSPTQSMIQPPSSFASTLHLFGKTGETNKAIDDLRTAKKLY